MEACIEFQTIRKRFGRKRVLRGIDLQIFRGETLGLLGGSGSGKSVLLKHIIGLLKADAGEVIVDGQLIRFRIEPEQIVVTEAVPVDFAAC